MIHIFRDAALVFARTSPGVTAVAVALVLAAAPGPVLAQSQSGSGWFVPEQAKPATTPRTSPTAPQSSGGPRADQGGMQQTPAPEALLPPDQQGALPPLQVQLPPMPEIPSIPKGSPTPAAIIGVLSVPDVLRVSTAYQLADKELAARRNKVTEDGQKEQNALRDMGQAFANERAKLTPEQIRAREKEYADRVNESRRMFSERARVVQEAGQYVMAQIERVIEVVAQQVAAARGVNLVLNRSQVLGTTNDFDLTPQVADMVNKVLPTVVIPPDGISPSKINAPIAGPRVSTVPDALPAAKKTGSP